MKWPFVDKVAKRFTKSASEQVKKEAKKTAIDLIPAILTIGTMVAGYFAFKDRHGSSRTNNEPNPFSSNTRITTNNYFLGDVSEDIIKKILEDKHYD